VRRIFELCANGTGYTRIAKTLNAEQAPSPRPQQGRPAGWAPTTVNDVLHRAIYRGEVVWNKTRKRDRWGQHKQTRRPDRDVLRMNVPALRIVSENQWNAAHARLAGIRAHLKKFTAMNVSRAHARDFDSKYLMSGFGRYAVPEGRAGSDKASSVNFVPTTPP
jgi:Recombinase